MNDNYTGIIFIWIISAIVSVFIILQIEKDVVGDEWIKLKEDCELSAILDNGNYQYACKIESNPTTVIYDKLDAHDWERFKIKNNCQLIQINLTVKNKKQWSCDNNVNFYYDDK